MGIWSTLQGTVIIFALFSGKFGRKLVTFLIEYIAITIVDMMVMSVNMLVTGYEHNFVQSIIDNTFGMVLWIILTVLVYHKRKKVSAFIQTISYGYILLVLVFLLCVCVVAGTSYLVLNGEITQQAMRQTYFFNMLCIVVALVICVVLFYLVFSRKKVQHEKEIEEKVEDSIEVVAHKLGMHEDEKEDFTKPGYARTLLLKRCWYAWNKMENEWEQNYRWEIITARHIYEVKHGKEDTE